MRRIATLFVVTFVLGLGCRGSDDPVKSDTDGSVSDGPITTTEGGVTTDATILQIRTGVIKEGTKVLLKDVIVSAVDGYGTYTGDLYVQDAEQAAKNTAIKLFQNTRTDGGQISDLSPGDHVKVEGTVKYWTGPVSSPFKNGKYVMELDGNQISKLGGGNPPIPAVVSAVDMTTGPDAEAWESSLLTVKDIKVMTLPDAQYGDFTVTGGLAVDDDLYPHSPKVGDCLTVTGVSVFLYEYRLNPRGAADVATATNCQAAKVVTIKDIQDTTSANHAVKGDEVKVTGIITAVDSSLSTGATPKYYGFMLQDGTGPYSGIYIFHSWDNSAAQKPAVGEEIELTGTVDEYYDLTELKNVSWTVKGTKPVPAPELVAAADVATTGTKGEQYEGVLLKVENLEVGEIVKDSKDKALGFKAKTSGLIIDYNFYNFPMPQVGDKYSSITGPLDFTFGNFKIYPRDAADMVKQ